ncbi:MAG: DALR anticodon-binding domain-containing protein, partial [Deltaproteobacteria bacterium]|nr:DALR anticodon-binding domain-containing protein [Deltaproteobacteria bacterium]
AHARICGIFKKAEEKGIHLEFKNVAVKNLMLPEELALIQLIQDYPHELSLAIHEKEPHRVAFTLMEVARALQSYYAKAKEDSRYHILSQNVDFALPKLYLLHHIQTVLKDGLTLLGVSAPERMDSLTNE